MSFDPNTPQPPQPYQSPYQQPYPPQQPAGSTIGYAQPAPWGYSQYGARTLLPVQWRARAATICFWCLFVAYAVMAILSFVLFLTVPDLNFENSGQSPAALLAIAVGLLGSAMVFFGIFVTTVVFYCMWQYRVHSNAHLLANRALEISPGWGVGYWFIPILNLFRPYQAMQEIDDATPSDGRPVAQLIAWWWVMFIASIITSFSSSLLEGPDDAMTTGSVAFDTLSTAASMAGVVLIIRIIRSISDRQASVVGA